MATRAEILAAQELLRRQEGRGSLLDFLFKEQRSLVESEAPYRTADCSRRAGKSVAACVALLRAAERHPNAIALYLAQTRIAAKRNLWDKLKNLNQQLSLGGIPNESELSLKLPNGARVVLSGAASKREVERFRGPSFSIVLVDEAQSFPTSLLSDLVDDVLSPALMDTGGPLILLGTPAPVRSGYFYDQIQNPAWEHHHWDAFNNPHIKAQVHLERELKRRGVDVNDPSIQREFYGLWIDDTDSLVLRYDPSKNDYGTLPTLPNPAQGWTYIIGLDIGWLDSDAIAVLAYSEQSPDCYLVEESIDSKQTTDELIAKLVTYQVRYHPQQIFMDTGGLGKKVAQDILQRAPELPIKAAEKPHKLAGYALLNSSLQNGHFKAKKGSRFAHDCVRLEWDRDKSTSDKLVVSDRYHSDSVDATLYAFRAAQQWRYVPPKVPTNVHSQEWANEEIRRMSAKIEKEKADVREMLNAPDFVDLFSDVDPW